MTSMTSMTWTCCVLRKWHHSSEPSGSKWWSWLKLKWLKGSHLARPLSSTSTTGYSSWTSMAMKVYKGMALPSCFRQTTTVLSITTSNYLPLQGYWLATKPTWTKIARRATQNMRCGLAVTEFNVIPWQSKVTKEEGEKLAAQYNMKFFEAHVWKVWSEVEWNAMFPRSVLVCSCQAWKWKGHMWAGWKVAAEIDSDTGCKYCGLILSPSLQCRQFHDRYSHLEKIEIPWDSYDSPNPTPIDPHGIIWHIFHTWLTILRDPSKTLEPGRRFWPCRLRQRQGRMSRRQRICVARALARRGVEWVWPEFALLSMGNYD